MNTSSERVTFYYQKCEQHLSRVRVSHLLALRAVDIGVADSHEDFRKIVDVAFPNLNAARIEQKLMSGLNQVHLVALKADFELFLNRVLTALVVEGLQRAAEDMSAEKRLKLIHVLVDSLLRGE